jgi:hypothetical protein
MAVIRCRNMLAPGIVTIVIEREGKRLFQIDSMVESNGTASGMQWPARLSLKRAFDHPPDYQFVKPGIE